MSKLSASGLNSTVCYFPDRVTTGDQIGQPEFVPCDPIAPHSACCAVGESCVGKGLCYSDIGTIYRGGCTDKSWSDSSCPVLCTSSQPGIQYGYQSGYQFLTSCGGADFVCGTNQTVCTANPSYVLHTLAPGPILQLNITGNAAHPSNTTSSSSSSTSSTGSGANSPSSQTPPASNTKSSSDHTLAVGVGVAIPLAVLLLLALLWALWERKQRMKESRRPAEADGTGVSPAGYYDQKVAGRPPIPGGELDGQRPPPQELQ